MFYAYGVHTYVMNTPPEQQLEAARAAQLALEDEYNRPDGANPRRVAAYHQAINYGLKTAEVSALIGIRDALRAIGTPRNNRTGEFL